MSHYVVIQMLYVTGMYALNVPCSLETCGDWHQLSMDWEHVPLKESDDTIWKDYGIERNKKIPYNEGLFNVANHIRACLDLIADGKFFLVQGMKEDYICNDSYNEEIFSRVMMLKDTPNWNEADKFMEKEYMLAWITFKKGKGS